MPLFCVLMSLSYWAGAQCTCNSTIGAAAGLDLYWVGGNSLDYNDRCNWRLNSITSTQVPCQAPRSSDNVFFMDAAFTGTSNIIRIDQNSNCHNMVWDDNIQTGKGVRLIGLNVGVQLDVYGNLEMASKMDVTGFNGLLRFTATQTGVVTVQSRGHDWRLYNLIIALGPNTELQLVDALTVNNRANSNGRQAEGGITLESGHFNTNGQTVRADRFYSINSNTTRRLTLDNSTITLDGQLYVYSGWYINFNATNNAGLSATGSHIILNRIHNSGTYQLYSFGTSQTYDSITIDKGMGRHLVRHTNINCSYFNVKAGTTPISMGNSTVVTDEFEIGKGAFVHSLKLSTDIFRGPNNCDMATMENIALSKKTAGGTLLINNILATNVRGNASSSYTANTCYEGANCPNITFSPVVSCTADLRYTDAGGDQDWQNVANWVDHATGLPATHIPTPWSNVYFDANSFPNANKFVALNGSAYAQDMRWQGTVANADLRLTNHFFLSGTLELAANMAPINEGRYGHEYGRGFICTSPNNDSLITRGIFVNSSFQFLNFSRYNIVDTLGTSMLYQSGGNSYLTIRNANIRINNYIVYRNGLWENASLNYTGSGWTGIASGSTPTFINTTFYLNNSGTLMVNARMPNVVVNGPGNVFPHSYFHAYGDLTINASVMSSMKTTYNYTSLGRIVVNGNMILAPGVNVLVNGNPNNYVRVQGNVLTSGNCSSTLTSIQSDSDPIEFTVNGTGSNLQDLFLQGLDASMGQPLTAVNSADGGNNTNITFSSGTGQTFYWTGTPLNANDLVGNWSNPDHWTVIPGKTTGDGTCIPAITDSVVYNRAGSDCTVDINAFCKSINGIVPFTLRSGHARTMYIAGSWANVAGTNNAFLGVVNFVGSGTIRTDGVDFVAKDVNFNKIGGVWDLQSDFRLNRLTNSFIFNIMKLVAGTINTNGYDIYVRNRFISNTNNTRVLNMENSVFEIGAMTRNPLGSSYLWNTDNSTNMTVNGGLVHILPGRAEISKRLHFGDGNLQYDSILVESNAFPVEMRGEANFNYAELKTNMQVFEDNAFDTLVMNGGYTYRFNAGTVQTLNAPHGNMRSRNVGPGNFINIETNTAGQLAYIKKDYGNSFCLSYIKVKDVRATKAATQPAACTLPDCWSLLEFQTDQNSDSISIANNDWGIWRFKLTPLINPNSSGADTVIICKTGNQLSYPIQILGTSPYIIDYTWQDATNPATNGGQNGIIVYDDDNDPNTPFIYNVPLNPVVRRFDYSVDIATTRCGDRILSTPVNTHVIVPTPQPLVQVNRTGSCSFENESNWYSIIDYVDDRPIVSLLDSVGPTDNDSLGNVQVDVFFEPSVQTIVFNGDTYPYLQRHWQITPTNNHAAKVRIYFTQAELTALGLGSFAQRYNGPINPATELLVLKYNDGTFPTATTAPNVVMVPHTVVASNAASWAMRPNAQAPFSTTNGLIALEFEVSSFSHFVVVLTQSALLNTPNLLEFEATPLGENQALTKWSFEQTAPIAQFTVQHTTDFSDLTDQVTRTPVDGQLEYQWIHEAPQLGINYYRLRTLSKTGEITYSAWKTVNITASHLARLFPNPTERSLNVQLYAEEQADLHWEIYNSVGQTIMSGRQALQAGMQTFELPTQPLFGGLYRIRLTNEKTGYVQQHSFIKQ